MSWTRQSAELQRGLRTTTHEPHDQLPVAIAAAMPIRISRRHVVWGSMGSSPTAVFDGNQCSASQFLSHFSSHFGCVC